MDCMLVNALGLVLVSVGVTASGGRILGMLVLEAPTVPSKARSLGFMTATRRGRHKRLPRYIVAIAKAENTTIRMNFQSLLPLEFTFVSTAPVLAALSGMTSEDLVCSGPAFATNVLSVSTFVGPGDCPLSPFVSSGSFIGAVEDAPEAGSL